MTVSRITSHYTVDFAIERRFQPSNPSGATIAVDISLLGKVLKIAHSLFNIKVIEEAVVLAYPALHRLKLLSRSQKQSRRLELTEFERIFEKLRIREQQRHAHIPFCDILEFSILST